MKTFLPIVFVLMTCQISAQNYRTANTTSTTYYEDSLNWMTSNFPFKADNFSVQSNGDTLISFLEVFNNPFSQSTPCIDTASTPWQGQKALLKTDGTDIYYNENNEEITIKTQANLGETWLLFDENITIEATLSQIGMQNIFGVMDSVKTLTLQVFDSLNNLISHSLNGENYQLSQSFGFVSAPDFYHFPNEIKRNLKGVQSPKLGIYNITRNDVYDFNIGDEFHIAEGNMFSKHYYKVLILSKQLDANNDWTYTYDVVRHVFWEYDENTSSVTATEVTSGTVPQQLIPQNIVDLSPLPITFYQDNSGVSGFGRVKNSNIWDRNKKVLDGAYWMENNGCWTYGFLLGVSYMDTYLEGLGGPYGGSSSGNGVIATLEYYKKGNEIYGNPINFDLIMPTETVINESQNLKIYPNPAQEFLNIELENQPNFDYNILVINNLGQIAHQGILTQNVQQIEIQHLPKGIYTLQIRNEEAVFVKRFVKE
ncbi:MAG: T9SS type A sorting domain-containing protein [Saprospiraceae bacterium]|nr:T9SS type A sorting domain-containing protein [Saprospiraceae bacterium]